VLLLLVAVSVTASWAYFTTAAALDEKERQRLATEELRRVADGRREEAQAARKKADQEAWRARRLVYAGEVQFAGDSWEREDGVARQIGQRLDHSAPKALGEDLREFAWRYLWGQVRGAPGILREHDGTVTRGAWRSDGKLVTIDTEANVRCWDTAGRQVLHKLALGRKGLVQLDLAAGGALVAALTSEGVVRLIDPSSGQERRIEVPGQKAGLLRLTDDGRRLVVYRGAIGWLWDTATGKMVSPLARVRGALRPPGSPRPDRLLVTLAPDGQNLAVTAGNGNGAAVVLNVAKGTLTKQMPARVSLGALAFSGDGRTLAGGNIQGRVYLWDVATCTEKVPPVTLPFGTITCLAFSADGRHLAVGTRPGAVALLDLGSRQVVFRARGHEGPVAFVSFSPDGQQLFSGSPDATARIWDLKRPPGTPRVLAAETRGPVFSLVYSPDGRRLAATLGNQVRVWDSRTWQAEALQQQHPGQARLPTRLAFSPDGKRLAVGRIDGAVDLCDVASGERVVRFEPAGAPEVHPSRRGVTALAFSPDGSTLAVGHGSFFLYSGAPYNQAVRIWDVRSGKLLRTLPHTNSIYSLAFTSDGALLASVAGRVVRLWNVEDWQSIRTWQTPGLIDSLALSPGNDLIAAGEGGREVHVWEVRSGKARPQQQEPERRVRALAFTPDGRGLVVGGNQFVQLWHVDTGRRLLTFRHPVELWSTAIAPDGNALVTGDIQGTVRLWEAPPLARIDATRVVRQP
jgi:WD40 repeat protein